MEDGGHLTARSSVSGGGHSRRGSAGTEAASLSRPPSRRASEGSSPADGGGPATGQGRWGAVLGGVPFLPGIPFLSTMLSPRQTSEEREAAVAAAQEAHLAAQQQAQQAAGSGRSPEAAAASDWQQRPSSGGGGGSGRYPAAAAQPGEGGGEGGGGGTGGPGRDLSGSTAGGPAAATAAAAELDQLALERDTTPPMLLQPGNAPPPELSEPSALMSEAHLRALAAVLPARHRQAKWSLAYSTHRDGISLSTLLRSCRGRSPTVLLVRDMGRCVGVGCGCMCVVREGEGFDGAGRLAGDGAGRPQIPKVGQSELHLKERVTVWKEAPAALAVQVLVRAAGLSLSCTEAGWAEQLGRMLQLPGGPLGAGMCATARLRSCCSTGKNWQEGQQLIS